jgi:hypothetical protein
MLGDWDAALAELTQAADAGGLADIDYLVCYRGWVAALRGDTVGLSEVFGSQPRLIVRPSEANCSNGRW